MGERKIPLGTGYLGKLSGRDAFNVRDAAMPEPDLDLDALEDRCGFNETGDLTGHEIRALIQRLREAEQLSKHLEKMAFQWQSVAITANARIAQLERVREAANQINSAIITHDLIDGGDVAELRAALAAVEDAKQLA